MKTLDLLNLNDALCVTIKIECICLQGCQSWLEFFYKDAASSTKGVERKEDIS